jgi:hypothetical protein
MDFAWVMSLKIRREPFLDRSASCLMRCSIVMLVRIEIGLDEGRS